MTTECYKANCPHHGIHHGEDGPFCFEDECRLNEEERLIAMGYDLSELENDNPYNVWMQGVQV